tara:strand:+ start:3197 stop:3388 length:192 start_codon:yes stop_codon:yes gene_type:complete
MKITIINDPPNTLDFDDISNNSFFVHGDMLYYKIAAATPSGDVKTNLAVCISRPYSLEGKLES